MPRLRPRYLIPALAALLIGGYALKTWLIPAPAGEGLLTAEVRSADIEQTVIATGTLEAYKQVSVGAQVSGQITRLHVDFGDQVKQGDPIAEIDSMTQQNDLANAKAALANAKAQRAVQAAALKKAQLAFARQKSMLAQNATSREDYETAEADLDTARAQVAALDAQIQQAQIQASTAEVDLGYTQITAPIDGTVVGVVVKEGQTVNSAQSAPTIVKVAQLDRMTVKAEISEADVVNLKPGLPVYFTILGEPGKRHSATLRMIEPAPSSINDNDSSSSASSGTTSTDTAIYYIAVFDVPNPDGKLRISMTTEVNIVLDSVKDAPSIPVSALGNTTRDGRYVVQVLAGNGKVEPRRIRIGLEDSINAQVLEGLEVGDKVVLGDAAAGSTTTMRMRGPMRL
ncbi:MULTISPECIES: efflux RND transporter periplasmic adaptor subunit [unclassified Pseudomonas]|uniref:efflux RND transporter periplasmic adaptor subunit n=1 Tax=unclassified Pseudomonas TaxID=196821 RepID=UPI002447617B|nr:MULTISPECIES: efflux RND transporter periplasmic adaptor subunit [unclassified Pseudomonas]MDH0894082.1 efflux RND transporter periplasmic adaptor subunit [Pseudomonas sp. GD03875]MDH1062837.1 efflux RND transporter periplasmic adaptor subunit [Pseudomonas sp. GD03985]